MTTGELGPWTAKELARPAPQFAVQFGADLAARTHGALAVLFYGSALRTEARDGILDFYVLTSAPPSGLRGLASRTLWPDVSYREGADAAGPLRAKVATMTLDQFTRAAAGDGADTTIWARFVQPTSLVWSADARAAERVAEAVTQAAMTAAGFAAALGPPQGLPDDFWRALFRETYAAEFRVEATGRETAILEAGALRYDALLSRAWKAGGLAFEYLEGGELRPQLSLAERRRLLGRWRRRRTLGRPLNVARLVKAAFTFEGAARYAAWKIERHTGVAFEVTPFRERHPVLSAPSVLWRLWRARRSR